MSEEFPLVSIALCTYNGDKFLSEQLDTLVGQTYPHLEIVIVDDASTDTTISILTDYAARYPSIKVLRNPTNLGYQRNFEKALGLCCGKYILISDQDDIWKKDKVFKLLQAIENNVLIYHDSAFVDEDGKSLNLKMSDKFNMVDGNDPVPFLFYNCVSGHSMMFRRELLEYIIPFPDTGMYDHYIAFIATGRGRIKYLSDPLVNHRQHQTNSTDILDRKRERNRLKVTLDRMVRENTWLKICSESDEHPASELAKKFYRFGKERTSNYFNFRFGYMVWKNQEKLTLIKKKDSYKTLVFALRQIWGIKIKKLVKAA